MSQEGTIKINRYGMAIALAMLILSLMSAGLAFKSFGGVETKPSCEVVTGSEHIYTGQCLPEGYVALESTKRW
jgi:hypothetical protein